MAIKNDHCILASPNPQSFPNCLEAGNDLVRAFQDHVYLRILTRRSEENTRLGSRWAGFPTLIGMTGPIVSSRRDQRPRNPIKLKGSRRVRMMTRQAAQITLQAKELINPIPIFVSRIQNLARVPGFLVLPQTNSHSPVTIFLRPTKDQHQITAPLPATRRLPHPIRRT
jgi:hypothetical protein